MKLIIILGACAALVLPQFAWAEKTASKQVNEYGEEVDLSRDVVEQVPPEKTEAPKKSPPVQESNVGADVTKKPPSKTGALPETVKPKRRVSDVSSQGRAKRFRVGLVGPGIGVVNKGVGAMMTMGAEGEYFFFEKLSAGLRIETATKFKGTTILGFVPRARYVFDFDNHPRWSVYAQGGVGLGLYFASGTHAAADIAIPGGGFWWQWTRRFSVGADTSLHIFVRDFTAVGFTFAPAVRYMF